MELFLWVLRDAQGALDATTSPPGQRTSEARSAPVEQRAEWGPAPGEVGSWIMEASEEQEVRRGRAPVQGWRRVGAWLLLCVVPVLHRAAGTG